MHSQMSSTNRKFDLDFKPRMIFKKPPGPHSYTTMRAAGFEYTNNGDAARCSECGLEVSGLTAEMKPFAVHKERSPTCPYVLSMMPVSTNIPIALKYPIEQSITSADSEPPSKRQKIEPSEPEHKMDAFFESNSIKAIRNRTFSHWPHRSSPSGAQMIQAGFFCCNVGDRVICIYCNLICQQWTPQTDNPCEVHKTLSPKCPYVTSLLVGPQTFLSDEERSSANLNSQSIPPNWAETAHHIDYVEPEARHASFSRWPNTNVSCVADLVRAGFYYTGTETTITCFYCNGSREKWDTNDDPMVEHARRFPYCAYIRQLCGNKFDQMREEQRRPLQKNTRIDNTKVALHRGRDGSKENVRSTLDQNNFKTYIRARLDLPISQGPRIRQFKQPIVEKSWEDQIRIKDADFHYSGDLLMACNILQKQLENINGQKENIIIPSVAMQRIRERQRSENTPPNVQMQRTQLTNSCVLCSKKKKCLACIPCGHPITCAPCSYVYTECPICHQKIEAFVRVHNN